MISSHPGQLLAVHCHSEFLEEHIQIGDSRSFLVFADLDIHNHTEPQLARLVAHRRYYEHPFFAYCSRHAIKGSEMASVADFAFAVSEMATSDPMSDITNL